MSQSHSKADEADERAALRAAVAGATPLRDTQRINFAPPKPSPRPRRHTLDETNAMGEWRQAVEEAKDGIAPGDADNFLRNGVQRKVLRDLRRGRWAVESRLDLHGLNRQAAHERVAHFLSAALSANQRCICIVHGRGYGSPGRTSVLRPLVKSWLACYDEVLAFCHAPLSDGGDGALWVLLKSLYR